ncbi:hypothetical protein [Pengzhenrongella sicca]|uniref:Uncharacterized protein n=1 Tax=Pengzhenrongella sicca TaxID=2819238 RepID=A0A8A4ZAT2_9MICO|nr:hypothetical protein [Pengzhenrongella sicca]QTE28984.1 hypothetical protein J4E96_16990 [Pengzhenrongella sicca]
MGPAELKDLLAEWIGSPDASDLRASLWVDGAARSAVSVSSAAAGA